MTDTKTDLCRRLLEHLNYIYPGNANEALCEQLVNTMGLSVERAMPLPHHNNWDERDNILITYGNTIARKKEQPLHTLHRFLNQHLEEVVEGVHILPFFPYSSDDGFSVIDYLTVNPSLGDWDDIEAIAGDYKLMADLVINHMSSRSRWFENFRKRVDPGKDYFYEACPDADFGEVVRPRNSPLLTDYETVDGTRHVWCTFSADQVDLNFSNPQVLVEFVNIIRYYLERGVKIFRLDAVAFLWKKPGTPCIHLQETHEIIKLLRTLMEHHSPDAVIVTETNVPNRENLTYFGNANEAHVIYNFSLPPLLVYTLLSGDCCHLKTWMMSMPPARDGTAYLNFIASHDGIGLRPLDGLLSEQERHRMVKRLKSFGGKVTMRKAREGHDKPYELNIALYDAFAGSLEQGKDQWQEQRFICAHEIMLALEGIPALYIHSFFGTENDHRRVQHTGRYRSINRHIWDEQALLDHLSDSNSHHQRIFLAMKKRLLIRRQQPAFHPNATQFTLHLGTEVFAFWRQSINRSQSIFCVSNVTDQPQSINLSDINLISTDNWCDLISGTIFDDLGSTLELQPYQSVWISNRLS